MTWGKANDHFQGMIDPDRWPYRRDLRQGLRHEWVTGIIVREYGLADWLAAFCESDLLIWNAALWAIHGHHPKPLRPSPPETIPDGSGSEMTLLLGHDEVKCCLRNIASALHIESPPTLLDDRIFLVGNASSIEQVNKAYLADRLMWQKLSKREKRFTALVKACVISADVAGSVIPTQVRTAQQSDWIHDCFSVVPSSAQLQRIINNRLTNSDGSVNALRPFQQSVGEKAADVTLVKAGCGSGKTLAAYYWALQKCSGQRLYFCYPTTGTATEGFRDYLVNEDEHNFGAELFHSRASVDLEMLLDGDDDGHDEDRIADQFDTLDRIESLASWSTPIVNCTADTVLGLVQNHRRSIYAWPAFSHSGFVFDEIHAYDDRLFSALLQFLNAMQGTRILLMTASLPTYRQRKLEKLLQGRVATINGPAKLENLKRYHRVVLGDLTDPLDNDNATRGTSALLQMIQTELSAGGKVLWVCNTVERVTKAAELAQLQLSVDPIVYHSRFRYEDRVAQHGRVIDGFKNDSPAFAITSQVCEMSLDLSATLLITDLASIAALIQRLGRLNRRATSGSTTMPFVIISPRRQGSPYFLPYGEEEVESARQWIEALPGRISQRDLVEVWQQDQREQKARVKSYGSTWLDGGPRTEVGNIRDPSYGISVIMSEDLDSLRRGDIKLERVLLPMPQPPRHTKWQAWTRYKGVPVSPLDSITYSKTTGGEWRFGARNGKEEGNEEASTV